MPEDYHSVLIKSFSNQLCKWNSNAS